MAMAAFRGRIVAVLTGLFCATAAYGVWHAVAYNLEPFGAGRASVAAVPITAILLVATGLLWNHLRTIASAAAARLILVGDARWLCGVIALAAILRILWCAAFPPTQSSDAYLYFSMARQLAEERTFVILTQYDTWTRVTYATWPPGLPLALAPLMWLFGPHPWVPVLMNLLLTSVVILGVHQLAGRVAGAGASRLAGAAIALSPNLIMLSGQASKEMLVLALLTTAAALLIVDLERGQNPWRLLGIGACMGGCALTQPSLLLAVPIPAAVVWVCSGAWRRSFQALLLTLAAAAAVIAPWTIRNALVLGEFVVVSTGGGSVLYRANHDQANGGYLHLGEDIPYERLPETEQDRLLRRDALRWILENPGKFAHLVFLKNREYLGDDSGGAYNSMKRGSDIHGTPYILAKGLSNLLWVAVLLGLVFITARRHSGTEVAERGLLLLLSMMWMYLLAMHSFAESGSRHHLALTGLIVAFIAAGLSKEAVVSRGNLSPAFYRQA